MQRPASLAAAEPPRRAQGGPLLRDLHAMSQPLTSPPFSSGMSAAMLRSCLSRLTVRGRRRGCRARSVAAGPAGPGHSPSHAFRSGRRPPGTLWSADTVFPPRAQPPLQLRLQDLGGVARSGSSGQGLGAPSAPGVAVCGEKRSFDSGRPPPAQRRRAAPPSGRGSLLDGVALSSSDPVSVTGDRTASRTGAGVIHQVMPAPMLKPRARTRAGTRDSVSGDSPSITSSEPSRLSSDR